MSVRSRLRDGFVTYWLMTGILSLPPFVAVMMFQLLCTCFVLSVIEGHTDGTDQGRDDQSPPA